MIYTIENLKTQLSNKMQALENEKGQRLHVMSADFQLAKDYGENLRIYHFRTITARINCLERQILDLELRISEME